MNSKVRIVLYIFLSLLLALSVGTVLWCVGVNIITVVKIVTAILLILWLAFMVAIKLNEVGVIGKKEQ